MNFHAILLRGLGKGRARDCYKKEDCCGTRRRGEEEQGKTLRKAATVAICLLTCIITSAIALAHAAPPHPPHTCSPCSFVGVTVHPSHAHNPTAHCPGSLHLGWSAWLSLILMSFKSCCHFLPCPAPHTPFSTAPRDTPLQQVPSGAVDARQTLYI